MKKRVLVLMSGGVDSSLAAYILKKSGYDVIGCTMRLFLCKNQVGSPATGVLRGGQSVAKKSSEKQCCSPDDINEARRTAQQLGIKHYVVDKKDIFEKYVIENFVSEYLKGRTPNPCIICNLKIKFEEMLKFARGLGCDFLATGHYARIEGQSEIGSRKLEVFLLKKGIDETKDQSYFLYGLTQKNLPNVLFPVGNYRKTEIRKLAKKLKLSVADKKESQEICFVEDANYREFLETRIDANKLKPTLVGPTEVGYKIKSGNFVNTSGKILGTHKGLPFYTIGQRRGLGLSVGEPIYVVKINTKKNEIVVGKKEELISKEFEVTDISWTFSPPKKSPITANVRIRYRHKESEAKIFLLKNNTAKIVFEKSQMSITPGQAAVFYKKDVVLGGGIIREA
ncbi:MAG: tRNA 2-thiouridine(34) synthase MnmA [Elusimicrobiota bacterium]